MIFTSLRLPFTFAVARGFKGAATKALGCAEGLKTGAADLLPMTSGTPETVYCLLLSPVGTDGNDTERPSTAPNTVNGKPRRTSGAPRRRALSTTSYPPAPTSARPV